MGNRTNTPEKRKSTIDSVALVWTRVEPTAGGASSDVEGIFEEDPMCMFTTVPVSAQAAKKGSQ